ncbi:glycoside hydrolase family 97 protein [candidate division KSB1 bacterium]|nr:glycoside hydrolase family 97 protein [candidate division KSB1 bacterium]RQW01036.1 MAG: glycoside hydrolase family 97 protein [candidate division KSB1 bacterium]
MKRFVQFGSLVFIVFWIPISSLHAATVSSPDARIVVTAEIKANPEPYPVGEHLYYSIQKDEHTILLDSPFRIDFKGMPAIATGLSIVDVKHHAAYETWQPVCGTHAQITTSYNELTLILKESNLPNRALTFSIRAFNDGIAFQYGLEEQEGFTNFIITKELSEFHFPNDPTCWIGHYPSHATHQETEYNKMKLSESEPGHIIACPLLVQLPNAWVALTEANLVDWAGLYYTRHERFPNAVVSLLSPRIDQPDVAVISKAPRISPWRVVMIGERPGDLIESNIIVNLADPLALEDTDWIEPGISAWDRWWCGSYAPDFAGKLGVDNASMKYFIDLAADMGWEYQLVDWEWYGPPFDPDKPFGSAGNPAADLTKSIDAIDIPELVKYAADKGVKILVWLDWENADRQMARAFPLYEQWGVAGVKVDFMARDDQEMVNFYHRLVKMAARHHLTVDFHGAYKPTGLRRAYPNLLTREGVLGNEYSKWSDRITPTHDCVLPFTRMLCGPMDYTPGGFRNKTPETFRIVGGDAPGPFVMNTRAHQLAQFVVYESPLQVACDSPYNYRAAPAGTDFLKVVPTTWDESRVIDGFPGEFIVMVRLHGETWYLGGLANEAGKTMDISLDFLGDGAYTATIYADPDEAADYPDRLNIYEKKVTAKDKLTLVMAGSGGVAIQFVPVE